MIKLLNQPDTDKVGTLVLRPNQSMSWSATWLFLTVLAVVSLTIGITFSLRGYWLVLPFTVLELGIIACCFHLLLRRSQQQQVIEFYADTVQVSIGREHPEKTMAWQRYFTKIFINPPRYRWYAPTIVLRHRNESIEIGAFLNAEEKDQLVMHLRNLVRLADQRQVHLA